MYKEQIFSIPELVGISQKTIDEHIKLYAGYVKNANLILEKISEYKKDAETHAYALGEIKRRFSFEFDGMRNHEYYFRSFEGGPNAPTPDSDLSLAIEEQWGSMDNFLAEFKSIALTRGIGWVMLYYDPQYKNLATSWVDEQHLGHLTGLVPVLALDMWEHSFVMDYMPSGKKQYIEDFFKNLNWGVVEENYGKASR